MSLLLLLRRIFLRADFIHASALCMTAMTVVSIWAVASSIAVSAGCGAVHILPGHGDACSGDVGVSAFTTRMHVLMLRNQLSRWLAVMICDGVTEVGIVALAAYLTSGLQMPLKEKGTVCIAFVWRLGYVTSFRQRV